MWTLDETKNGVYRQIAQHGLQVSTCLKSCVVPEDWMSVMIVPLYEGKVERTECSNYRSIIFLSVVGKIYAAKGLIDDEQAVSD